MKLALILMSLGAAFVFTMGTGQASWLHFDNAGNRVLALSTAKDNKDRNKHEKKKANKQEKRDKDDANEKQAEPVQTAPAQKLRRCGVTIVNISMGGGAESFRRSNLPAELARPVAWLAAEERSYCGTQTARVLPC